ncbi:MAG TPA: alpha/beta fold hydrolase [Nevskiaceae bacterium]|nr:alpha/beta fold hydrolase [Nevskiaceae bacterium]
MKQVVARLLLACACGLSFWSTSASARIESVPGVTHFRDTILSGGRSRNALFFRPTTARSTAPALLILLHYKGGNAEDMAALTQVQLLVRDFGIWVALPESVLGGWNNDPANDTGVDDVGYLSRLIDSATARFGLNRSRIYLAGYSAGGFMALRYACEQPSRVAAVASVAAALSIQQNARCYPSVPTPIAMINGTGDSRVRYDASTGMLTVPGTARRWAQINGCPTGPSHSLLPDLAPGDKTRVEMDQWKACGASGTGEVRLYTVDDGGHTWPDSDNNCLLCGRVSYDIDGTLTIWNFVKRFRRLAP